jgi:transcriptional regulator with XRE-family HTH domain
VAERIRTARQRAGISARELAEAMGLSIESFDDLESYDDEAFMCVSLSQLGALGDRLGLTPVEIVAPIVTMNPDPIPMSTLLARVVSEIERKGETAEAFGTRLGWDVSGALANPQNTWQEWNLECLQAVCKSVGVDWLGVLASWPKQHAS